MFIDLKGEKRIKLGLHTHTTISDGRKTPEESARIYKEAGYDAIAFTDHWKYGPEREIEGLHILSGCEYNIDGKDARTPSMHIVGLCMKYDPEIKKEGADFRNTVDLIHKAGGIAVLAHPAWSMCQIEDIMKVGDFDALEIFNTVSGVGESDRPYSGAIVDLLANKGIIYPLLSSDDAHYYKGDEAFASVMVKCENDRDDIVKAIKKGDFYASNARALGKNIENKDPEVHLSIKDGMAIAETSPCSKISFFSNIFWESKRVFRSDADNLEYACHPLKENESYIRIEVTDSEGRTAYSNIEKLI